MFAHLLNALFFSMSSSDKSKHRIVSQRRFKTMSITDEGNIFEMESIFIFVDHFQVISADEASSSESDSDDDEDDDDDEENEDDDEDQGSEEENEEGQFKGNKKLYQQLYDAVSTCKIDGRSAADPFVRLPNRRYCCVLLWLVHTTLAFRSLLGNLRRAKKGLQVLDTVQIGLMREQIVTSRVRLPCKILILNTCHFVHASVFLAGSFPVTTMR